MSLKQTVRTKKGDLQSSINEFKKGCQPRSNLFKDESGDLADSYSILNRWKNYFYRLLNVHGVTDVRQTEIHTAQPLVPEPSSFEVEIAIEKYKLPGTDQILAELIQAGSLHFQIHKLINCIQNKKELPDQWKESIILPIYKKGDKTGCHNYGGISFLSTIFKIVSQNLLLRLL
jgi:hypothetical protein